MKNSLKYIAILSVAGATIATAAETAGLSVSTASSYELPLIAFIGSLVLMTFIADYRRQSSSTFEPNVSKVMLTPANEAFGRHNATTVSPTPRRIRRVRHQLVRS